MPEGVIPYLRWPGGRGLTLERYSSYNFFLERKGHSIFLHATADKKPHFNGARAKQNLKIVT